MEGKTTNIRAHAEPRQRRPGILTLGGCSVLQTLTCQGGREGGNIFLSKEIKFCIAVLYVCMTHILRSDHCHHIVVTVQNIFIALLVTAQYTIASSLSSLLIAENKV